ncbi:MAG: hypothetical protein IT458_08165 [Planctomycetes bacterium]|nr:hypothetical protein [Planctomycetota bacterium]
MRLPIAIVLVLASLAAAQGQNPHSDGPIVPLALRTATGSLNWNGAPFAGTPTRFQQVVRGDELPRGFEIGGLGLRKDGRIYSYQGRRVDLEIRMGPTSRDHATLGADFAANFDAGAPRTVLPRQWVRLPDVPWNPPATPDEFFGSIRFDQPFEFRAIPGRNLLIEVLVYGNEFGSQSFTYPLDAGSNTTSSVVSAPGPNATTGFVQRGSGLALCLLRAHDRRAGFVSTRNPSAPAGAVGPRLRGGAEPLLGSTATVDFAAGEAGSGAILVSAGPARALRLPMPGYQLLVHADLAQLLAAFPVALPQGFTSFPIGVGTDPALLGADFALQGILAPARAPATLRGSNLLLANVGAAFLGSMEFGVRHGPYSIAPFTHLVDENQKILELYHNQGETWTKVQLKLTKPAGTGPLQVLVNGATFGQVAIEAAEGTVTVDVPPNGVISLFNAGIQSLPMDVTFTMTIVE